MPFNIICLSETYLNFSTTSNDDDFEISGDNLIRSDHPSNNKRGGVCIYYKNFLPLQVLSIQYLQEYINFELNIGGKICKKLIDNLELILKSLGQNSPFLIVLIGDLNAKSKTGIVMTNPVTKEMQLKM